MLLRWARMPHDAPLTLFITEQRPHSPRQIIVSMRFSVPQCPGVRLWACVCECLSAWIKRAMLRAPLRDSGVRARVFAQPINGTGRCMYSTRRLVVPHCPLRLQCNGFLLPTCRHPVAEPFASATRRKVAARRRGLPRHPPPPASGSINLTCGHRRSRVEEISVLPCRRRHQERCDGSPLLMMLLSLPMQRVC